MYRTVSPTEYSISLRGLEYLICLSALLYFVFIIALPCLASPLLSAPLLSSRSSWSTAPLLPAAGSFPVSVRPLFIVHAEDQRHRRGPTKSAC